ncbi:MAG TPA: hypothetical protein PK867_08295 [Pirellulales bacterium]|nr:hypothetical protein [Pirellulales bacterium]
MLRLLAKMPDGAETQVLYATESLSGIDRSGPLRARGLGKVSVFSSMAEVVADLDRVLSGCFMGTRLYVAGPESFMGSVVQVAAK